MEETHGSSASSTSRVSVLELISEREAMNCQFSFKKGRNFLKRPRKTLRVSHTDYVDTTKELVDF